MSFVSARKRTNMTQAEVAKILGVTDAAVSQWENGTHMPRVSILVKLAGLYGCSVDDLLHGD